MSQLGSFIPEVKSCIPNIKKQTSKYSEFKWGEEEEKEFYEVREKLHKLIPISPVDTSIPLILHTDASNNGVGWILSQVPDKSNSMENISKKQQAVIEMGSATLTDAQRRYSPE